MRSVQAFSRLETSAIIWSADASTGWCAAALNARLDVDPSVRDAEMLEEADSPELVAMCRDRLFVATAPIAAELAPATVLAEVQIVRYHAGGKYIDHRDTLVLGAPRALSLVCYLNDDFTGGATAFAKPDELVEPCTGMAIVFSPLRLHRAEPVISGTKYVITAWYHSPVRDAVSDSD